MKRSFLSNELQALILRPLKARKLLQAIETRKEERREKNNEDPSNC